MAGVTICPSSLVAQRGFFQEKRYSLGGREGRREVGCFKFESHRRMRLEGCGSYLGSLYYFSLKGLSCLSDNLVSVFLLPGD